MINKKLQFVEYVWPGIAGAGNTGGKLQFTDQPYLRGKQALSLIAYCSDDFATSPQGNTLCSTAQMKLSYLTLYTNDPDNQKNEGEYIQYIPLVHFHRIQNSANTPFIWTPFQLDCQVIIWEKSYITFATPLNNTANVSFCFTIGFQG